MYDREQLRALAYERLVGRIVWDYTLRNYQVQGQVLGVFDDPLTGLCVSVQPFGFQWKTSYEVQWALENLEVVL